MASVDAVVKHEADIFVYDTPGTYTITAPPWVTSALLSGCGAGVSYDSSAGTGGITSFGNLLSLGGGSGAIYNTAGTIGSSPVVVGYVEASTASGGSGLFGSGGALGYPSTGRGGYGYYNGGSSAVRYYAGGNGALGILIVQWVA